MKTQVASIVHPWYKGTHEWQVKGVAQLEKPIEYGDPIQGKVSYDPKIMVLDSKTTGRVLWFAYWMSTTKTKGKMKWGQGPPMLEEGVFMELIRNAIRQGFFSRDFLEELDHELELG